VVLDQVIVLVGPLPEVQALVFCELETVVPVPDAFVIVISAAPALGSTTSDREATKP